MTAAGMATAVIAAAGSGTRLGAGSPKALVEVAGRPMAAWSLDAFAASSSVDAVVLAAPEGHESGFERLAPEGLELTVVTGGASRSESIAQAMPEVGSDVVAIHDAARPLVTAALIDELVASLDRHETAAGVIAAAPISDTVKRANIARIGPRSDTVTIAATEDRELLWAAQTPQVFRAAELREALAADPTTLAFATDDASLVEAAGGTVLLHRVDEHNFKVTTVADLLVAEVLLAGER
jgi:2-C-methyl-D-erythritol 4-phosphate cytidylyltransferase